MSANGSVMFEGISGASLVPAKIPTRLLTVVQIFSSREESKRLPMERPHKDCTEVVISWLVAPTAGNRLHACIKSLGVR
jgi:hypothetical protein